MVVIPAARMVAVAGQTGGEPAVPPRVDAAMADRGMKVRVAAAAQGRVADPEVAAVGRRGRGGRTPGGRGGVGVHPEGDGVDQAGAGETPVAP